MKQPKSTTVASLDEQEKQALAVLETIRQTREAAKAKQINDLAEYLKGVPVAVAKLTGQANVGIPEVISLFKKVEIGTLGKVGVSVGSNHGMHAKRLNEEEESKVRAFYISRKVNEQTGQPMKAISAFCAELNISGQTYDARRKKFDVDATIQQEISGLVAAFKAGAAATPAAAPAV